MPLILFGHFVTRVPLIPFGHSHPRPATHTSTKSSGWPGFSIPFNLTKASSTSPTSSLHGLCEVKFMESTTNTVFCTAPQFLEIFWGPHTKFPEWRSVLSLVWYYILHVPTFELNGSIFNVFKSLFDQQLVPTDARVLITLLTLSMCMSWRRLHTVRIHTRRSLGRHDYTHSIELSALHIHLDVHCLFCLFHWEILTETIYRNHGVSIYPKRGDS